ncbi:DUF1963 domain-containing protein [Tropicibacter oceani]|uniref:DUF1963 domain-containing protein n=1 Tax=Tropicibacter oceani TaxID=3058420 RepID=A0ABY8QE81_9RHOB|nr:DUF1963 domain-containing protein [Tropicibacter oceani]WGW02815.1 DUF1963 domain-containing protein [Tropicibacter oceani]
MRRQRRRGYKETAHGIGSKAGGSGFDGMKQGIWLRKTPAPTDAGTPGCFFGGRPNLPAQIAWPHYGDENLQVPLHFLLQIDLAVLRDVPGLPEFARQGTLFFFVDPVYAPVFGHDLGGARVIHVPGPVADIPERDMPGGLPITDDGALTFTPSDTYLREMLSAGYPRWPIVPTAFARKDPPDFEEEWIEQHPVLLDADGNKSGEQTVFHALFFGPDEGDENREYMEVEKDAVPLLLLLLDSDPDIEFGFSYTLFWINKGDLANNRFENIMIRDF